jgi:hypothetical protein
VLLAGRQSRIRQQAAAAQRAEADSDIVDRLTGYIDRKPQPLELLAYVNDLRPREIYFTKVSVEGGLQLSIDAATSSLAVVNEFEAALKGAPALASVEVRNTRAREGGGTFQLSLPSAPVSHPSEAIGGRFAAIVAGKWSLSSAAARGRGDASRRSSPRAVCRRRSAPRSRPRFLLGGTGAAARSRHAAADMGPPGDAPMPPPDANNPPAPPTP